MPPSSKYITQINNSQVFIFELVFDYCDSCKCVHAFAEMGTGTKLIPPNEWDYDIIYESLSD